MKLVLVATQTETDDLDMVMVFEDGSYANFHIRGSNGLGDVPYVLTDTQHGTTDPSFWMKRGWDKVVVVGDGQIE